MSTADVLRINSDTLTPLNIWLWLNDYKTYGKNSYVFKNKKIYEALMKDKATVNDGLLQPDSLEYHRSNSILGNFYSKLLEFDSSAMAGVGSTEELITNVAAFNSVLDNRATFDLLRANTNMKGSILNSNHTKTAIEIMLRNTKYNIFLKSQPGNTFSSSGDSTESILAKTVFCTNARTDAIIPGGIFNDGSCGGFSYTDIDFNVVTKRVAKSYQSPFTEKTELYQMNLVVRAMAVLSGKCLNSHTGSTGYAYGMAFYKELL